MNRILLLGCNGQVGWELRRALAPLGTLIALDRRGHAGLCGDLSSLHALADTVRHVAPHVIVNAAAYTAVDAAEREPLLAQRINAEAPGVLAHEAARLGALLVHYSTDYVFDGSSTRPWQENDAPAPLNHYGLSKRAGEEAILASGAQALILRTSWVYATRGHNFAKTMLRLAQERDTLRVIHDQHGAPTGADLIADVTAHAVRQLQGLAPAERAAYGGLYHLAAAGETSWYEYAHFVLNTAQQHSSSLKTPLSSLIPIPSSDYSTPARRPHNSRLNTEKLRRTFQLTLPDWREGVARLLAELMELPS